MANTNTGVTYSAEQKMGELIKKGMKLFPLLYRQFKHVGRAWFDVDVLNDGSKARSLMMKNLPNITPTLTVDGEAVFWNDYGMFDFSTDIKTKNTAALVDYIGTYEVTSSSGFAVGDTVYIIGNADGTSSAVDGVITQIPNATSIKVKVKRVNGADATATNAINVEKGAKVRRGGWLRNDQDEITRPIYTSNYMEFKSYVQHFSRRVTFTKAEINQEYRFAEEVQKFVENRIFTQMAILIHELNVALYKGTNEAPTSQDKKQMLGLEKVCYETNGVVDLKSSTDPIKDLFKEFQKAQTSNAVSGTQRLQVLCNTEFLDEIAYTERDKIRYNEQVKALDFVVPVLSTPYGEVELLADPVLNELYAGPVAFTMPRELVTAWYRENVGVSEDGTKLIKDDRSVRVYKVIDNVRERDSYDFTFECGVVYGGMGADVTPYRMIKNFKAPTE